MTKSETEARVGRTVGVHEAKTQLSRLLREVELGAEFEIVRRSGAPVARLVPAVVARVPVLGSDAGRWSVPDDFDDEDPAITAMFSA